MTPRAWMIGLALWLGLAGLAYPKSADPRLEASKLVTGRIEIDAQGAVSGYTLDKRDELAADVLAHLDATITHWRFEPVLVGGQAVAARSNMSMRLVLKPAEKDTFTLSIRGANFGPDKMPEGTVVEAKRLDPPPYPNEGLYRGGSAEVYLLVKVAPDGSVSEAIAEQVNMLSYSRSSDAPVLREAFEAAAIKQAKKRWRFQPPTRGEEADDPYWTVRVPVYFRLGTETVTNGWKVYDPGPRRQAPWRTPVDPVGFSPDALPAGAAHLAGASGLRLLATGASP